MAPDAPAHDAQLAALVGGWLASYDSRNTRAAYGSDFGAFANWCVTNDRQPLAVTLDDLASYLDSTAGAGASNATLARRKSALDSFFRYACAVQAVGASPMEGVPHPGVETSSSTATLGDADAAAVLRASDRLGAKPAALVRLLMLDGMKLGEVIAADVGDFSAYGEDAPCLVVERRDRAVRLPVQAPSARRLSRYLGRRRRGPLFLSDTPGRESSRLTRFGADHILKKVAATARISTRLSANALRRRYVTTAVASGSDVYDIRDHFGHRDVRTAMRYLEPSSTSQRRR